MSPDKAMSKNMIIEEKNKLKLLQKNLSENEKQQIVKNANELLHRQNTTDSPEILPKIETNDIPKKIETKINKLRSNDSPAQLSFYDQHTNGLFYQDIIAPINTLNEMDFPLLKIHNMILTEIGIEDKSYLETQNLQTKFCGGIKAFTNFFTLQ